MILEIIVLYFIIGIFIAIYDVLTMKCGCMWSPVYATLIITLWFPSAVYAILTKGWENNV